MICPEGHDSAATDYCDTCGMPMGAPAAPVTPPVPAVSATPTAPVTPAAVPTPAAATRPTPQPAAAPPTEDAELPCPNCGAPNARDALFCEVCGYDHTTGAMPRTANPAVSQHISETHESDSVVPQQDSGDFESNAAEAAPPGVVSEDPEPEVTSVPEPVTTSLPPASETSPASPASAAPPAAAYPDVPARQPDLTGLWVAEVWIDPGWCAHQGSPEPLPSPGPPVIVRLRNSTALIGRPSLSRGIRPDIDCGADSGVSRSHAQLSTDGTRWWVEDLGSANGTFLAATVGQLPDEPLPVNARREFDVDDRIYLGSWTRIVVRPSSPAEIADLP